MLSRAFASAIALLLASTATASAGVRSSDEPTAIIQVIPARCHAYAAVPDDAVDSPLLWNNALSLATCAGDASVAHVTQATQLAPMLDALKLRLAPALLIYMDVLRHAPAPVQLKAAYLIGMAEVSLIQRARGSLPPRDEALHAALEPLLGRVRYVAQLCFLAVERAGADDPDAVTDDVGRWMVASSHEMLHQLGRPQVEYEDLLAAP